MPSTVLDQCRKCTRLHHALAQIRCEYPAYHNRPVAAFGPPRAGLLIVGLAPGKHGANATGIPFTGDASGDFLWPALEAAGLARAAAGGYQPVACRITNAVKCLPPQNRPVAAEINQCNNYLKAEIAELERPSAILALGAIAHKAVLKARSIIPREFPFAHGAVHALEHGLTLFDSYHCSRYNTQTRRLTRPMFDAVLLDLKGCVKP